MCALNLTVFTECKQQRCGRYGEPVALWARRTACKPLATTGIHGQARHRSYLTIKLRLAALNEQPLQEPSSPVARAIPAIALAPGALALLSVALRGTSEVACIQANTIAALAAALAFLVYFCTTLTEHGHVWVSRLALSLRPAQDQILLGCGLAATAQLCTAAWLCLSYPVYSEGVLIPLYGAGYASLAILVASQRGRRLRGRKKLEIEAGEGERHSVMAQGSRIAARNYTWLVLLLHLMLQTVSEVAAAVAGTTAAAGGRGSLLLLLPGAMAAVAYGILAVLYGVAGACKFLPSSQLMGEKGSAVVSS